MFRRDSNALKKSRIGSDQRALSQLVKKKMFTHLSGEVAVCGSYFIMFLVSDIKSETRLVE
jgi:hypothetical protein